MYIFTESPQLWHKILAQWLAQTKVHYVLGISLIYRLNSHIFKKVMLAWHPGCYLMTTFCSQVLSIHPFNRSKPRMSLSSGIHLIQNIGILAPLFFLAFPNISKSSSTIPTENSFSSMAESTNLKWLRAHLESLHLLEAFRVF